MKVVWWYSPPTPLPDALWIKRTFTQNNSGAKSGLVRAASGKQVGAGKREKQNERRVLGDPAGWTLKQKWSLLSVSWWEWSQACVERPDGWRAPEGTWTRGFPEWPASGRRTRRSPLWSGRSWPHRSFQHDPFGRYDGCSLPVDKDHTEQGYF